MIRFGWSVRMGFLVGVKAERYEWDKFEQGFLLGYFCWGYLVGVGLNKNKNEKVMLECLVGSKNEGLKWRDFVVKIQPKIQIQNLLKKKGAKISYKALQQGLTEGQP